MMIIAAPETRLTHRAAVGRRPAPAASMVVTTQEPTSKPLELLESCCSPVTGQVLGQAEAEKLAGALKAVADPARLRLISIVAASETGEVCVCDFTGPVGLSQPTVSHHLKVLVDGGVLAREQRGKWAYYRLVPDALDTLSRLITAPLTR
jgi:ArsR family transcriptional regulator, arsenate/arsenite/antimonite-responsive transcriptional repressor